MDLRYLLSFLHASNPQTGCSASTAVLLHISFISHLIRHKTWGALALLASPVSDNDIQCRRLTLSKRGMSWGMVGAKQLSPIPGLDLQVCGVKRKGGMRQEVAQSRNCCTNMATRYLFWYLSYFTKCIWLLLPALVVVCFFHLVRKSDVLHIVPIYELNKHVCADTRKLALCILPVIPPSHLGGCSEVCQPPRKRWLLGYVYIVYTSSGTHAIRKHHSLLCWCWQFSQEVS